MELINIIRLDKIRTRLIGICIVEFNKNNSQRKKHCITRQKQDNFSI